jgi:VWFA-related protein
MKFILNLFCLILLIFTNGIFAQSDQVQKNKKTLISVPVTVSDRDGRYISGLKKDDFLLYENDVEQKIASFTTYDEPLDIALLLDTSGSTKNSLEEIKDAAKDFIELLNPKDRCVIATFDSQVKTLNTLTDNRQILKQTLKQAATADKEGSVVLDAIEKTIQNSFTDTQARKVIVVLSDGKDSGSSVSKNELLSRLEESDISIYTIFFQTGLGFNKMIVGSDGTISEGKESKLQKIKPPKKKKKYSILIPTRGDVYTEKDAKLIGKATDIEAVNFLKEISDTTAGRFYQSDAPNLSGIFKKIAGELRQQYRIGYYSKKSADEAATDEIIVKVKRNDVVVLKRGKFRAKQL